jgi:predicted HAD superfamily phosphohydrolase YqeG
MAKTIAVDFDGVMNTYTGWKGEAELFEPRPGLRAFLEQLRAAGFKVVVYSTRPASRIRSWLVDHDLSALVDDVTNGKPMAIAYIDDRAVCFDGDFDAVLKEATTFKAHWEA